MKRLVSWFRPNPAQPLTQCWMAAVWIGLVVNYPLWQKLMSLPEVTGARGALFIAAFAGMIAAATGACLSLLAWPKFGRGALALILVIAAAITFFIDTYSIVFDPPTVLLLARTSVSSARDLVSAGLLLAILVLGIAPAAWLVSQRTPVAQRMGTRLRNNLLSFTLGAVAAACFGLIVFSDHFSAMREHEELRYMVTPLAAAYSVGAAAIYSRGDQSGPSFIVAAMRSCCRQHRGPNQLCCCWMPAKRHVP